MEAQQLFAGVAQLGLGGIVFVIWYFDQKRIDALQDILKEQIAEKELMRQDRLELLKIVKDSATIIERATSAMGKLERRISA